MGGSERYFKRVTQLVVDEYQDLGVALHRLVLQLCFSAKVRLFAVGDADQSIYGFTGAKPELLRELAERPDVEVVRLKLNYRSGTEIIMASETVLGETRGYRSNSGDVGAIYFHRYGGGLEEQAEAIFKRIIPDILNRNPKSKLGAIAVLYLDKYDGSLIAEKASAAGLDFVRVDSGTPYQRTPLTRWILDCAGWCSGGWQLGDPKLSLILRRWNYFNRKLIGWDKRVAQIELVHFLFQRRSPEMPLSRWLEDLLATSLGTSLTTDGSLQDEHFAFVNLQHACLEDREVHGITLGVFSGETGSF